MGKTQKLKSAPDKRCLPTNIQAHSLVCHCFGIGEKELEQTLKRMRKITPNPDNHFPRKWSRTMPKRAEAKNAHWHAAVLILQREAMYERIRREEGKPLFSFTGKVTEEIVFSLLKLYERLLPKLEVKGVSKVELVWLLVENVFMPTVFIQLAQAWRSRLTPEFQGEACWYLPLKRTGEK